MKSLVCVFLFFFSIRVMAQDFSSFQTILNDHHKVISEGNGFSTAINYTQLAQSKTSRDALKKQKDVLKKFDLKSLMTKEQALAFWINAYNFFMVATVVENGFEKGKLKIDSVKDLGSFFNPYKIFKKEILNVGGRIMSLDQIEKKTLLGEEYKKKGWKDARVHFAVNCASVGCPPLLKKVYTADSLDQTLDDNIKMALKTDRHFSIKGDRIYLTHLFKWYKKDFTEQSGSVKDFLLKFISDPKAISAVKSSEDYEFIPYDWNLNRPENFKK